MKDYAFTLRLVEDGLKYFGPGVMKLLEKVDQLGSLRAAAQDMEMAYSKAWKIVRNAERALGYPLLESAVGGRKGGGAAVTAQGAEFMEKYRAFDMSLHRRADELYEELFGATESGEEE